MGNHAEISWDVTFPDDAALAACAADLRNVDGLWLGYSPSPEDDRELVSLTMAMFGEDFTIADMPADGLTFNVFVSPSGRCTDFGPDANDDDPATSGLGVYSILARYASGTADWVDDMGNLYRIRFANGTWARYNGSIVYAGDPGPVPSVVPSAG